MRTSDWPKLVSNFNLLVSQVAGRLSLSTQQTTGSLIKSNFRPACLLKMPLTVRERGLRPKHAITWLLLLATLDHVKLPSFAALIQQPAAPIDNNSIQEQQDQPGSVNGSPVAQANVYREADCGTIISDVTSLVIKNPQYPEPIYTRSICEIVIERSNSSITKLAIKLKKLELFMPTMDGECHQDRFAVYTDLNVAVTPVLCGNHTGETMSVAFAPKQTSLVLSIITSETDHDRFWVIEVDQET